MSYVIIFGYVSVSPIILLYHFLMLSFWVWGDPFQLQGKASMSQLIIFYFRVVWPILISLHYYGCELPPIFLPGPLSPIPTPCGNLSSYYLLMGGKSPTNRLCTGKAVLFSVTIALVL